MVFSEKTDVPQLWIFREFFYCCDLENKVKVTKIWPVLCYVPIIHPWKFVKNPTTGSQNIMQTRKSKDADANGICTLINMSPSL